MFEYEVFLNGWIKNNEESLDEYALKLLEVTQFIRILKYIKNSETKKEYSDITKQLLKNIIE
jgi:hypothetical protein